MEAQSWILDDLGSILGPPEGRFLCFFEGLSLQLAGSDENVRTYEKHTKTMCLLQVFSVFGDALGRLWEALGGFGKLWGALGDVGGVFGKSLGGFGKLWGGFQSLSSPRAFVSSPIYLKKNQTPDQPL